MRAVIISDTHGFHRSVKMPEGDMLIHAGDITMSGEIETLKDFNDWLGSMPYEFKIVIAGNHDFCFEHDRENSENILTNCIYLHDSGIDIGGIKFYGSPWQPWFFDWAFNLQRGPEIRKMWDKIPYDTDVLVTHGPPAGYGDLTKRDEKVGCADLLDVINNIKPKFHIFGHIHEGHGAVIGQSTAFINASTCTARYKPTNNPIVIDLKG